MARNANTRHRNCHTAYLAASGGGKSSAMHANPLLPNRGGRLLAWDPDGDHWCLHLPTMRQFLSAVRQAIASGKQFRLGYNGPDTPEAFEDFCAIVWAALDGDEGKEIDVIIEELADVCPSVGKAGPNFGRLLRKGRKFGARIHMASQRPQEIPKTAISQAGFQFIGIQNTPADIAYLSKMAGVRPDELASLQPLEFFVKESGRLEAKRIDLRKMHRATPKQAKEPQKEASIQPAADELGNLEVPAAQDAGKTIDA